MVVSKKNLVFNFKKLTCSYFPAVPQACVFCVVLRQKNKEQQINQELYTIHLGLDNIKPIE